MINEADIEKLIFRCFTNYWNTRMPKKHNVGRVSIIAANDVWQVVKQYLEQSNKDSPVPELRSHKYSYAREVMSEGSAANPLSPAHQVHHGNDRIHQHYCALDKNHDGECAAVITRFLTGEMQSTN